MVRKLWLVLTTLGLLVTLYLPTVQAEPLQPPVLITEVQVGVEVASHEFIELYNTTTTDLDLTNWQLEYLSAAHSASQPAKPHSLITLSGSLRAQSYALFSFHGYLSDQADAQFGLGDNNGKLAKSGGVVRLVSAADEPSQIDCIRWGGPAEPINGCDRLPSLPEDDSYSIQRPLTGQTYNKAAGVANTTPISPQAGGYLPVNQPTTTTDPVPTTDTEPTGAESCQGLSLSELLPNPTGRDLGNEFIELYNASGQAQSLDGCQLQAGSKQYDFTEGQVVEAGSYRAFSDQVTKIHLLNSGGRVSLNGPTGQVDVVDYAKLPTGQALAKQGDSWLATTTPTPGAANQINSSSTTDTDTIQPDQARGKNLDCPAGKYRNLATNRCRNLGSLLGPAGDCPAGQTRNLLTNRCRKSLTAQVAGTSINLAACKPGQERNPVTNRCRSVAASAGNTAKACSAGQTRNPDTNRCRRSANPPALAKNASPQAAAVRRSPLHLWAFIGAGLLVAGYAVYEYRHDLHNRWHGFWQRRQKTGSTNLPP